MVNPRRSIRFWPDASTTLAVSLLLTSATQLRIPGTPVGPGELLLSVWLAWEGTHRAREGVHVSSWTAPWILFWVLSVAVLAFGWSIGLTTGVSTLSDSRDAMAYLLSATFVTVVVTGRRAMAFLVDVVHAMVVLATLAIGALLVIGIVHRSSMGIIDVWYGGIRFRGWAVNPNQMALLLVPLPWFSLALAALPGRRRSLMIGCSILLVGFGILTASDALFLAWGVGALLVGFTTVLARAVRPTTSVREAGMWRVSTPLVMLLGVVVLGAPLVRWIEGRSIATYNQGGQGDDRIARWGYGLQAIVSSPVVGFGPGSFAGSRRAFDDEEAHNSLIDWGASTGLIGVIAIGFMVIRGVIVCLRSRSVMVITSLIVLLFFISFHYALRQPILWFYLLAATALAETTAHRLDRVSTGQPTGECI